MGAEGGGGGGGGEARPGERPRRRREPQRQPRRPAPGGGGRRPGWGGEAERGHKEEERAGRRSFGPPRRPPRPQPRAPTPHSALPRLPMSPSRIWGVSLLLKKNFAPAASARETWAGLIQGVRCCALPLLRNIWAFFFFFCIIHSLPSPSRPSPTPLLLPPFRSSARTRLTPESSSLQVSRPGATLACKSLTSLLLKGEKTVFPSPSASSGRCPLRLCPAPGGSKTIGNPGFRGTAFPSFPSFIFFFFGKAQVLWRLLLGSRILSAGDTQQLPLKISLPSPRARAHTHAQRAAFQGPRGRWGRREHHPPPRPRPEPAGPQQVSWRGGLRPGRDFYPVSRLECRCGGNARKPCARDCSPERRAGSERRQEKSQPISMRRSLQERFEKAPDLPLWER